MFMRLAALVIAAVALWIFFSLPPAPIQIADMSQATECGTRGAPCQVRDRDYSIVIPKGDGPFPVFLFFHGSRQSGDLAIQNRRLVVPVLSRGYALVAPTAQDIGYTNGPGTGWINEGRRGARDDHRFVRDVLADIALRFPVDLARIVVAGSSNGATFAWYLACSDVDDQLTAFAPVAATPVRGRPYRCQNAERAYDLIHTHGTDDPVVPLGGLPPLSSGWPGLVGAQEAVDALAMKKNCQHTSSQRVDGFDVKKWVTCDAAQSVTLAIYEGGHGFPSRWPDFILDWYEALSKN